MTPQERDVIAGIFDRLRQAANQPRDPEAERFIADRLREQPYAVYAMAQSVYVQEQALGNLQGQVEQLQAEVQQLRSQPAAPAQSGGGFLSGIFGAYADKRELQSSLPADGYRHGTDELWFDFVADLGDGFDATYSVASVLAAPSIEPVEGLPLPRAELLVMGGDQVYPAASSTAT